MCRRSDCPSAVHDKSRVNSLCILIYFDEAHTLAPYVEETSSKQRKMPLDVLTGLLDTFAKKGLFTLFMSTQSKLQVLAPSAAYDRSSRHSNMVGQMHAPITETPFDCFKPGEITPSRLRVEDICDVAFMACFGRPL